MALVRLSLTARTIRKTKDNLTDQTHSTTLEIIHLANNSEWTTEDGLRNFLLLMFWAIFLVILFLTVFSKRKK